MARMYLAIAFAGALLTMSQEASAQICRPAAERTAELGCWIVANGQLGTLSKPEVFWQLDIFPTRAAADVAKNSLRVVHGRDRASASWNGTAGGHVHRPSNRSTKTELISGTAARVEPSRGSWGSKIAAKRLVIGGTIWTAAYLTFLASKAGARVSWSRDRSVVNLASLPTFT